MVEQELAKLGLVLPDMPREVSSYIQYRIAGSFIFITGRLPMLDGALQYKGKVGKDLTVQQGTDAARLCAQNLLSVVKHAVGGDWAKIKSIVRVNGAINCESSFEDHSKVMNGASNLLVAVFGEQVGCHTRTAIGVNSLPFGAAVEIDAVFELI
jgi:enamine deaminase RidA (YjgF/YER057c/UK114 family)